MIKDIFETVFKEECLRVKAISNYYFTTTWYKRIFNFIFHKRKNEINKIYKKMLWEKQSK